MNPVVAALIPLATLFGVAILVCAAAVAYALVMLLRIARGDIQLDIEGDDE